MTLTLTDKQRFSLASEAQRQERFFRDRKNPEVSQLWAQIAEALLLHWREETLLIIKAGEQHEQPRKPLEAK